MISYDTIGSDEDLAREVLVIARDIAPCIDTLADESDEQKTAIAILKRVFREVATRGPRYVKAQRTGPASVDYREVSSAFDGDPTRALRALCAAATFSSGHPREPLHGWPNGPELSPST